MKITLTVPLTLLLNAAAAQNISFFGAAICKTKSQKLFYRFDRGKFTTQQSTPIHMSGEYSRRFTNLYQVNFDDTMRRQHKYLYFSDTIAMSENNALVQQNRTGLTELFITSDALLSKERHINLGNDLLLTDNFNKLTSFPRKPATEETKYVGAHTAPSPLFRGGKPEITLDSSKIYRAIHSTTSVTNFLMNEEIGYRDLGKHYANSNMGALKRRYIFRFNRRIGNKMLPADIGGSYDIIIKGNRLLYSTGSEALSELKRKQ